MVVCQQNNGLNSQFSQDLSRRTIASGIGLETCFDVCFALAKSGFLERNAFYQREVAVAFSFLIKINDDALSCLLNRGLSRRHLSGAFTLDAVKDMSAKTCGMDTTKHVLTVRDIAHHKRNRFALTVVVENFVECAELCFYFSVRKSNCHKLNLDALAALKELPVALLAFVFAVLDDNAAAR